MMPFPTWPFRRRRLPPHLRAAREAIAESRRRADATDELARELANGAVHGRESPDRLNALLRQLTRPNPSTGNIVEDEIWGAP